MSRSQANRRAHAASPRTEPHLPAAGFVLLGGLTLFWGGNWPAMKIALAEIPVWPFRSLCLIVGGTLLLSIARLGGQRIRLPTDQVRPMLACALFNVVGWHLCSGYGVSLMAAGRASIIAFTMPVWAALLSAPVLGERVTGAKLVGLGFGMAGLAVLIGPDLGQLHAAPLGALFMLGAALSWATGTVAMKRCAWATPPGVLAGWQLLAGAIPITLGALILEPFPDPAALSLPAVLAVLYILFLPMVFCHWAWFKVVRLFPAAIAAIGTLAIPVIGVLLSGLALGEPIGAREVVSLTLVCLALGVVLVLPAMRARRRA